MAATVSTAAVDDERFGLRTIRAAVNPVVASVMLAVKYAADEDASTAPTGDGRGRTRSRRRRRAAPELAGTLRPMVAGLSKTWWSRPGLEVRDGRLFVAGRDAEDVAKAIGTPAYVYDLVRSRSRRARSATRSPRRPPRARPAALKAQREPDLLAFLRERCPWSVSTSARPVRLPGRSVTAGAPTRSAIQGRTSPSAIWTRSSLPASI